MSKQLAEAMEDGGLVGGLSMYDRVKRRSSAANRDDGAKKAALSAIREKTNEKKGTQVGYAFLLLYVFRLVRLSRWLFFRKKRFNAPLYMFQTFLLKTYLILMIVSIF